MFEIFVLFYRCPNEMPLKWFDSLEIVISYKINRSSNILPKNLRILRNVISPKLSELTFIDVSQLIQNFLMGLMLSKRNEIYMVRLVI